MMLWSKKNGWISSIIFGDVGALNHSRRENEVKDVADFNWDEKLKDN